MLVTVAQGCPGSETAARGGGSHATRATGEDSHATRATGEDSHATTARARTNGGAGGGPGVTLPHLNRMRVAVAFAT